MKKQDNNDCERAGFDELDLKSGDFIMHPRCGKGKVTYIYKTKKINETRIEIDFEDHGIKKILFIFAELKKL